MIESHRNGLAPQADGASLSRDRGAPDRREEALHYRDTDGVERGGCIREAAATGNRVLMHLNDFVPIDLSTRLILDTSSFSQPEVRSYLQQEHDIASWWYEGCSIKGCGFCYSYYSRYLRLLSDYTIRQGEWLEHRLQLEARVKRVVRTNYSFIARTDISVSTINTFLRRVYLIPTLDLICNHYELMELIGEVGRLDWRPEQ
jgi:hypothetical protein